MGNTGCSVKGFGKSFPRRSSPAMRLINTNERRFVMSLRLNLSFWRRQARESGNPPATVVAVAVVAIVVAVAVAATTIVAVTPFYSLSRFFHFF